MLIVAIKIANNLVLLISKKKVIPKNRLDINDILEMNISSIYNA